jgi:hypothetical protein
MKLRLVLLLILANEIRGLIVVAGILYALHR